MDLWIRLMESSNCGSLPLPELATKSTVFPTEHPMLELAMVAKVGHSMSRLMMAVRQLVSTVSCCSSSSSPRQQRSHFRSMSCVHNLLSSLGNMHILVIQAIGLLVMLH